MTRKPKILHIGGAHSVHLANLVEELDKLGYPQCILSYRKDSIVNLKNVLVYTFNYQKFFPDKDYPKDRQLLSAYISKLLKKEKPDIIHGHFLIFSCMAINLTKKLSNLPLYLTPWSARALTDNKVLYKRIDENISNCKYFLTASSWVFSLFQNHYKSLSNNMHVNWRLPLYLGEYHLLQKDCKDITSPRILSARVMQEANHQDLLVYALPTIFHKYPNATATFILGQSATQGIKYFNSMVALSKSLGIYNKCSFIGRPLSQKEFSDVIKEHNIIYSVSDSDTEGSQTTYQAVYSGAITLVKNSIYGYDLLVPNKNILTVDLNKEDIINKLVYSIDNIKELSSKFFDASRQLKLASNEYMLPVLTNLYNKEMIATK